MNTNQIATLSSLAEKNDWHNFCQYFFSNYNHLLFNQKLEIIKSFLTARDNLKPNQKNNALKWLVHSLSTSWIIEEKKHENAKILGLQYLELLSADQAISVAKLFWSEGEIENTKLVLIRFWSLNPSIQKIRNEKILGEVLNQSKDPLYAHLALSYLIDIGEQSLTQEYYLKFYKYYFDLFDLEDEKNYLWDHLWSKLNQIQEKWIIWELMKLDVGFITDIIIRNKTKLQLPHFRKKREIANAILLRKEWPTFNSTLLKYFECVEGNSLAVDWIEIINNTKVQLDYDSQQIRLKVLLAKPKALPKSKQATYEDTQNSTRLIDQESDVNNYSMDIINIKNKLKNIDENKSNKEIQDELKKNSEINWKEKVNILMLHEDYDGVLSIIDENFDDLESDEKVDFEIFRLEILIKIGQSQDVLKRIEKVWNSVQELEIFKIYKYLEGEALWMLNRKKEAADCYRKVVDIDPGYKLAKWRLVEYST